VTVRRLKQDLVNDDGRREILAVGGRCEPPQQLPVIVAQDQVTGRRGYARHRKAPSLRGFRSAPGEIRTPDLRFRRRLDGVFAGRNPRIYGMLSVD
jgi:hypothetical protein